MKRLVFSLFLIWLPIAVGAIEPTPHINRIVEHEIVAGFTALSEASDRMAGWAEVSCEHPDFIYSYVAAFSVWARVSHLRFGPSEQDSLAFALAFWPDPRGKTPKTLRRLLGTGDRGILAPESFAEQSVAARGFYALDYLLYDDKAQKVGTPTYRCALLQAIARDIAATAGQLRDRWVAFAPYLTAPGPDGPYRNEKEVRQVLFNAVNSGLQFSDDLRLGRPLGSFDKPRPGRAEAWRSRLSLTLLIEAVRGSGSMALILAQGNDALAARLETAITRFENRAARLDDPAFAGVATPQGRIRVEALQNDLRRLRRIVQEELGPYLGVSAGFNALDGD